MDTKLEALVDFLRERKVEKEVIEKLIVDNFNSQNLSHYNTGYSSYEIFTFKEKDQLVTDMAMDLADDDIRYVSNLIKTYSNEKRLSLFTKSIDIEDYVDLIESDISDEEFNEYYSYQYMDGDRGYYIYMLI